MYIISYIPMAGFVGRCMTFPIVAVIKIVNKMVRKQYYYDMGEVSKITKITVYTMAGNCMSLASTRFNKN
jgi:hypothetical protein